MNCHAAFNSFHPLLFVVPRPLQISRWHGSVFLYDVCKLSLKLGFFAWDRANCLVTHRWTSAFHQTSFRVSFQHSRSQTCHLWHRRSWAFHIFLMLSRAFCDWSCHSFFPLCRSSEQLGTKCREQCFSFLPVMSTYFCCLPNSGLWLFDYATTQRAEARTDCSNNVNRLGDNVKMLIPHYFGQCLARHVVQLSKTMLRFLEIGQSDPQCCDGRKQIRMEELSRTASVVLKGFSWHERK